jgi:hypothetical protein
MRLADLQVQICVPQPMTGYLLVRAFHTEPNARSAFFVISLPWDPSAGVAEGLRFFA